MHQSVHHLLIEDAIRRINGESIPRVKQCLNSLSEAQIWERPYRQLPAIGNLVLHVHGNARQWILQTLCGTTWQRNRDWEFDEQGPLPTSELINLLDQLSEDVAFHLPGIQESQLTATYDVQIFRESGVAIIVHAVEHFSYHTGQIARETKRFTEKDLGFYGDLSPVNSK
jgi:uncharacterized damage-inducible protein DinB